MKALLKTAPRAGHLEFSDIADPIPGKGDLLVQVHAAGICGTDQSLLEWHDEIAAIYNPPLPFVLGHEFSGIVVDAAAELKPAWLDRRVFVNPVYACGDCHYCRSGRQSLCDDRPCLGLQLNGGFAEYARVREANAYIIPEGVSYEVAALAEPFCVALHAMEQCSPRKGGSAVVVGVGPIGLLQIVALKAAGIERCIATGLPSDEMRLEIARGLGAETLVADEDLFERIRSRTDGRGADVVFETSGHPQGTLQAIQLAGKGAKIAIIGFPHEAIPLSASHVAVNEKQIIGVRAHNRCTWEWCARLLPTVRENFKRIITDVFSLREGILAFGAAQRKQGGKVLILPQA